MSVVLIHRAISRARAFSSTLLHPIPPSPPNQPRLTLNLQRESRFLSSSIGLALVHNIPATKQRQFQRRFQAYYLFFSHLRESLSRLELHGFMTSV